ncbi:MAG: hypothetical protein UX09_C0020G0012 [Candidatus Uhrbacteria bacterium GW2011_GWE2_45_35]|uniref:Uncharacterized protein n=2 Tax=Candidatus Uhriibacteriota TaxID=1752732 RepID=A0A0G1MEU9_9BACT|nr:MAG: hypothetical protein UW63_C0025G0011 [Candidatus Uhrbacteria bacterium GW2011_GWF2_44_350]KKU08141.1 MAG: hypothetical protein UX09_C0020G0012 [Candidatus Uhrbacteria bacterium GW2011_GWE2_45_35]
MPFVFFGLLAIITGIFFLVKLGIKKRNIEMKNGALAWILAGFLLLLWGVLLMLTGKF